VRTKQGGSSDVIGQRRIELSMRIAKLERMVAEADVLTPL
jgi:hypothetical protein